jgi:hypothetical protein
MASGNVQMEDLKQLVRDAIGFTEARNDPISGGSIERESSLNSPRSGCAALKAAATSAASSTTGARGSGGLTMRCTRGRSRNMMTAVSQTTKNVAILLLSLGEKGAAHVFKNLSKQEIRQITMAMATMPPLRRDEVQTILSQFFHEYRYEASDACFGSRLARRTACSCGCSWQISSAMVEDPIHLIISRPLPLSS